MRPIATDSSGKQTEIFWGEISPCEHLVQVYPDNRAFLDLLEGFVAGGLQSGEAVILIAGGAHIRALEDRLRPTGIDLTLASLSDQYLTFDAEEILTKFMINDWPDEYLFEQVITDILKRAGKGGRRVRAFGEMVALLWEQGHSAATIRLEHLWHKLCQEKRFSLFCAYPRIGFTQDADSSIKTICAAHSKVVTTCRE